eukprot:774657-Prymnesium_polylepis.2
MSAWPRMAALPGLSAEPITTRTISSAEAREQRPNSETSRGTLSTSFRCGRTAAMPRGSFSICAAAASCCASGLGSARSMHEFQS